MVNIIRMATISIVSLVTGAFLASSVGGDLQTAGLLTSGIWVSLNVLVRL
jgi:hypothetical protein